MKRQRAGVSQKIKVKSIKKRKKRAGIAQVSIGK
jgi:hypothetical protein